MALHSHILKSCVCASDLKIIETRGAKTGLFFQDVLTSIDSKSIEKNRMETVQHIALTAYVATEFSVAFIHDTKTGSSEIHRYFFVHVKQMYKHKSACFHGTALHSLYVVNTGVILHMTVVQYFVE